MALTRRGLMIASAAAGLAAAIPSARAGDLPLHPAPRPIPEIAFGDGEGRPRMLTEWRGRVVLLNLWATWCAPCRIEMPTLDRLQGLLGSGNFEVVALSVDTDGLSRVRPFLERMGVANLEPYVDPSEQAMVALATSSLPTTVLVDPDTREIARLVGATEWDAPDMVAFLSRVIAAYTYDGGSTVRT